jgi:acetyl esterase
MEVNNMKKKKNIALVVIFALIITGVFIIKTLTETSAGKINTYVAVNLELDKILNPKSITGESIEKIRTYLNRDSTKLSKEPIHFSNIKNITIDVNSEKIPVRIYTPEDGQILPIIIYSHGGSWISGNLDTHDNFCRKLSKNTKAIVISVDYRLAPENPFPAGLNDVYNVLQWTYKNTKNINGDQSHIAIAGDSAGGNLSAAVSLMSKDKKGPHITC